MRDEAVAISDSLCCAGADLLSSETVRSCKILAVALMLLTSGAKLINTAEEKTFETCRENHPNT